MFKIALCFTLLLSCVCFGIPSDNTKSEEIKPFLILFKENTSQADLKSLIPFVQGRYFL